MTASTAERRWAPWVLACALLGSGVAWLIHGGYVAEAVWFAVAAFLAVGGLVFGLRWGHERGALSLPGGRSTHAEPVAATGGIAVYILVGVACAVGWWQGDSRMAGLLLGSTLLFLVGTIDDHRRVSARTKILAQLLAGICLIATGWPHEALGAPGLGRGAFHLGALAIPVALLWIVAATNAFNLSDGIDGGAGCLGLLAVIGLWHAGVESLVLVVLGGALIGFLALNLPKARIFLGDAGSLVVGFVLAASVLAVPERINLPVAIGVFAYPLYDTALAITRRYIQGVPLFAGDRNHVHHQLEELLGSVPRALLGMVALAGVPLVLAMWKPGSRSVLLSAILGLVAAALLVRARRVSLARVVRGRRHHQRLYVLRQYIQGLIKHAQDAREVVEALDKLARDMPLAWIKLGDLEVSGLRRHRERVLDTDSAWVHHGIAQWAHEPEDGEPVNVGMARRVVICEILQQASQRLRDLPPIQPGADEGTVERPPSGEWTPPIEEVSPA